MLTCYGSLSRNRSVGVRLGQGERLQDILASSSQVAEGVATAGAHPRRAAPSGAPTVPVTTTPAPSKKFSTRNKASHAQCTAGGCGQGWGSSEPP